MEITLVIALALALAELAVLVPVQRAALRLRVQARNRLIIAGGDVSDGRKSKLRARLDQAGVDLSEPLYVAAVALAAFALGAAGAGSYGPAGFAAGAALSPALSELFLRIRAKSRSGDFEEQLGDALPMIAEGVKIGMTFEQAMGNVAETMEDPFKSQAKQFALERSYGVSLPEAIDNLAARVDSRDARDLATVVKITSETGGKMADVLESIAATINRRDRLRRHIAAVTADGRMSAIIISAIPAVLVAAFAVIAPDYTRTLLTTAEGWALLGVSAAMIATGNVIIRRIYRIKIN